MTNVKETSCRLCLKNITNKSFEVINNIIRDILDGLLLKLKLDSGSKEVICSACRRKLNTALEFKSTCLNTNNTIIPYVDNEKMLRLDLREVYMQEKKSELVCSQKICRLCMHPIKSEFRCIREEELETIQKLTPEMNVNIIKDPVVCNPCFDTLCTHNSFLKDCLEVEEKINSIFDSSATETQIDKSPLDLFIKTEDLDKEFDINEMGMSIKAECVDIKSEDEEGRLDPYGLTGQWLTDSLNDCVFTYDIAPVFTLMENHVMQEVCRMIGPDWGDGLFCPGGSYGNGTAINLARFERYPDVKKKGSNHIPRQAIFASEECHYSVYKYASFLGIGEDNVFSIRTNDMGEMIVEDLEKKIEQQIEEGAVPLVVVATFGTTVKGAFDPINQIADVSKKHSMWLHIDAAWGGSLIFSQKHRSKLNGIERANSVVINVHKLLAVPQQCSMLLIRDKGILHKCFSRGAEYLFQKDKHYDKTYDVGDKYLQCGRKCDVFKFWFMWKAKVAPKIRAFMVENGSLMLGYQPLKQLPNFFRFVAQNSSLTRKDVDFVLDHIAETGDALFK